MKMLCCWLLRWRKEPEGKEHTWALEAEKDMKMGFSLELLEGKWSCKHLGFSQVTLTADF